MNHITRIELRNIKGHASLVLEPGVVTLVEGRNAVGKTSLIRGVLGAIKGGHDPNLLRKGEAEGYITLTISNGVTVQKIIRKESSTLTVVHPETGRVSKPQSYIDSLFDSAGVDAFDLILCPPKKRAEYVLETMPLVVKEEDLEGIPAAHVKATTSLSGLDRLDALHKRIYDERTAANAAEKAKRVLAAHLRETLPSGERPDVEPLRRELREAVAQMSDLRAAAERKRSRGVEQVKTDARERISTEKSNTASVISARELEARGALATVESEYREALAAAERKRSEATATIQAELADRRREEELALGQKLEAIKEEAQTQADALKAEELAVMQILNDEHAPRVAALTERVAAADADEAQWVRAEGTLRAISLADEEAAKWKTESQALTASLDKIKALRTQLVASLPVPGLEIRDGDVYYQELPFAELNRATQMRLALEIAQVRTRKVGLIVGDQLESIDDDTLDAFTEAVIKSGLKIQIIGARHRKGDLRITTTHEDGTVTETPVVKENVQ